MDHVFLVDNGSADRGLIAQLRPHFSPRFVTFSEDDTPRAQLKAYAACMEERRAGFNWIAFFDLDEYLVLRERCARAAASESLAPRTPRLSLACLTF